MKELVFTRSLLPALERNSDRIGFIDAGSGREITYGQHRSRVARLSHAMSAELGVAPQDRVAVLSMNSVPYLELWHATMLGAAIMNPLNLRFSADELVYVLNDSGSQVVFVDSTFAPIVEQIRARTAVKRVVLLDGSDAPADVQYEDLIAGAEERFAPEPDEDSPAVLMYTGGTTGHPKGVVLTQRAEVLNQYHMAMCAPFSDGGSFLIQTPMFHGATMYGLLGATMFANTVIVLPVFTPQTSLAACTTYRPTITLLVPTMIGMVVNHPDFDPDALSSIRRLIYGASPMPTALLDTLLTLMPQCEIVQGYGMTEAATVLTMLPASEPRAGRRLASCGRAVPGVQLSIRDEAGNPVPVGVPGEVWGRGGNFLTEYLNKPEETAHALHEGWYRSGDVGYLDDEGYLFLVDRAKDMIISGGENVYCVEVENALATHPAVLQVAVFGIPHEVWGEAVHAICVLREAGTTTADELIAHARSTIAGYKVPRAVDLRTEPLPLSAAMKVLKRELRAPYWADQDRTIN
ncbi:MAG TPA: AMP-binding protein [Sporichthyaceae bacterium]|nr:AMP-binding protein [Sporichthyaceae bacterium]